MARTAYWVIDLASGSAPSNAQIAAGQNGASAAAAASGSEAFAATSGSGTITEATTVSSLSAGTQYRLSWTIYDDVAANYPASAPQHYTFTTAATISPAAGTTAAQTLVGKATALAAVTPDRIESTASFGTHVVSAEGVALIAPSIIASTTTFGTPVVSYIRVEAVSAPRIESTASFGAHTVARQAVAAITPGRIDSAASFGVPVVTSSATAQIVVERIESTVTFGTATVARTGSGSADPADVWSYVLSNGLTAEQNLVAVYEWLNELHLIHGLRAGSPMMVTPTQRTAASIVQEIAEAGSDVTVTRQ